MGIADNIKRVNERIENACIRSGRSPESVRLMGVTKFHGLPVVEEAWKGGIRLFGENRVQEALEKFPSFLEKQPEAELHMIGSLQRNKVKKAVPLFGCVESVDRNELIPELDKHGLLKGEPLRIMLELHTGESSKSGYPDMDTLYEGAESVLSCKGLRICGLMTMAPYTDDEKAIRKSFRSLVSAQKQLKLRFPEADWSCLSMGMSNDFEIAVEEGSTLLRIGSALFGERPV
ncbi:YggS family pyridoxal phosphate-dependent enzyme [Treponema sp. OttesenSCG-928-L16]|nr:YggS family pyridoxal phosphate-dependent enzyme [Treponema sp. OttesenSCG-928-L16]